MPVENAASRSAFEANLIVVVTFVNIDDGWHQSCFALRAGVPAGQARRLQLATGVLNYRLELFGVILDKVLDLRPLLGGENPLQGLEFLLTQGLALVSL